MNNKFTPKNKLSKKERRELDNALRIVWGMNPVTRVPANPHAYSRSKMKASCRRMLAE